ncbi:uncharacterized protein IUM83_10627 [Phytophthora cinnamomi]|uniref:uncharacterized protein n=1 Tax=Phytophthora cinnamomi TaxID=4785 RepID=UPI00355A2125|nr:hypothetical protein IUM83_10627 [Phytophthora cinnamomi]
MAPAEKGARKAQKQSDDAQVRDDQSRGAKDASGSRIATEEGPASDDEHLESKHGGDDEEKGRGSGSGGGAGDGGFSDPLQLVGVPASEMACRNGAHLRDGYGGLDALQILERFSDQDLNELESILGAGVCSSIPQPVDQPPGDSNLALVLGSLTMQRRFALVLTAFAPWHLAENAMNTLSVLKRMLVQYRHLKAIIESSATTSVRDVLNLRTDNDALRREWAAMEAFWQSEVGRVESEEQSAELRAKRNLVAQEEYHQHRLNAHADEIADLKEQLATFLGSGVQHYRLWEQEAPTRAVRTLHGRRSTSPVAWITNIHMLAADQPQCVRGDHQAERKKANDGDSASKPKYPPKVCDLTGESKEAKKSKPSSSRSKTKKKPAYKNSKRAIENMSWEEFRASLQLRASTNTPNAQLARPASSGVV